MSHYKLVLIFSLLLFIACGPSNKLEKYYSLEDKTVFDLIERLNKNPNDKQAAEMLPQAYENALEKRRDNIIAEKNTGSIGDRWMEIAKEREVTLQMYNAIKASPAASRVITNPKDPSAGITAARQKAAEEYYSQGLQYMNYNNREYAQKAYDVFIKADRAVTGYKDVKALLQESKEKSMLRVVVRPVDYYQNNWGYWGYSNDWLQQEIVRDLNAGSFRDVRFYTDWDARRDNVRADRVVEISFPEIFISNVFTDSRNYRRSKQIQTGETKSIPPKPVYETVYATVYITNRYMQSRASLECRIYEWATGRNILFDRFPRNYNWANETARYTGDSRALAPEDWRIINNNNLPPPGRNEIAQQLIRDCYQQLISRIRNGVNFY